MFPQTQECLDAKDHPGHIDLLNNLWFAALILVVAGVFLARGLAARRVAVVAGVPILVLSYGVEYGVWLATDPATADVAVGTGYSMAGSWLLAGLLTAVSATLSLVDSRRPGSAPKRAPASLTSSSG